MVFVGLAVATAWDREDVNASACKGHHGLAVTLSFGSLAAKANETSRPSSLSLADASTSIWQCSEKTGPTNTGPVSDSKQLDKTD